MSRGKKQNYLIYFVKEMSMLKKMEPMSTLHYQKMEYMQRQHDMIEIFLYQQKTRNIK